MILEGNNYSTNVRRASVITTQRVITKGIDDFVDTAHLGYSFGDMLAAASYCQKLGVTFPEEDYLILSDEYDNTWPVRINHIGDNVKTKVGEAVITFTVEDDRFMWVPGFLADIFVQMNYRYTFGEKDRVFPNLYELDEHVMQYGLPDKFRLEPHYTQLMSVHYSGKPDDKN